MKRIKFLLPLVLLLFFSCEKVTLIGPGEITTPVSYSNDIQPLFTSNCISCHGGNIKPDLREGKSWEALIDGGYVIAEKPDDSRLYKQLISKDSHISILTDIDKAYIFAWIKQGALNN